jgi:spore maturation protein CgeB
MAVGPMSRYVADGASVFYWRGTNDFSAAETSLPELEFNRVLFFGSRYGFRETLVEYLQKKGLPIDVYGAGWGTEFLSYENLAYRIPRYALNLGVSTIGYSRNLSCVKGRDIEVPSAGGLYLTNRSAEIEQVYVPGKEVLSYVSKNECYRRACEVLANPTTFMQMRRDGIRKARAFSWEARFNYLKEIILKIVAPNAD